MRIVIILILCFYALSCTSPKKSKDDCENKLYAGENGQESDSVLLCKLKRMNIQAYIGQDVGSFLANSLISKYRDYIFVDEKPGLLSFLALEYSGKLYIEIEIKNYVFLKPFDKNRKWELSLFKKERIGEIRISFNNNLVQIID